jgi:concanavalin A-like lectin/glucanase superfamily protein/SdrD B-like protein/flagellar hook capping protein FlgD
LPNFVARRAVRVYVPATSRTPAQSPDCAALAARSRAGIRAAHNLLRRPPMSPTPRWLAAAFLALALAPRPAASQTEPQTCDSVKVECCAVKPSYGDTAFAGFTGAVAAITYWSANTSGPNGEVVGIVNFLNQGAAPIGAAGPWLTPKYYGPGGSWNKGNLGTVFGVTFDDLGNLYVASSSCYGSDFYPGGLAGRIWKIDASTGAYSQFNNLPNFPDPSISPGQNMPALGNIAFDCDHRQLFVTNFEDGKIYRLSMVANAAPLSTFDPGTPDPGVPGFAPLGERLWAVRYHAGRVYYSIWTEDSGRPNASLYNTVWSVALNGSGDFVAGSQRLEVTVPHWNANSFSNPVSDISFGPLGQMLLAERTMYNDTQPGAHQSRLLEYICAPSPTGGRQWVPSGNVYGIGALDSPIGSQPSSAGGCDYDLGVGSRVWVTADAIEFGPDYVYGLQGLPNTGGDVTNSIEVDDNNLYLSPDKTEIGEIRISCQTQPQQPSELCGIKFNDLNGDGIHESGEPTLAGWTIVATDGVNTFSTVTDASGDWCIENLPPGTYVVHEVPQPGWSQTAPASVTYTRTVPPGTAGLEFGNFQNCQQPSAITCTAGRVDSFATTDGPEPSSPSPALLSLLNGCSPGSPPLTLFDVIPCHQCFGHTFDKCWSDSCVVTGAIVQIHLRAGDCTPQDDSLYFMNGASAVWGIGLSTLENLATGGTDPTWSFGDDRVFTLDLANLPPDTYGVTNILAALQNGQLGVLVRDGTGVDFIRIRVTVCCPSGNLGGGKFLDLNHNGVWDSGEPGLSGWTIQLAGPVNATTTTNASGAWSFTGLPAGTYTVTEVGQPNWINTAPPGGSYTVALPAGGNIANLNFGNWPCQTDNPCAKPPKGMVAWWPLDETVGTHSDDIALNNVGTWQGAPVVIPGEVGNALHLATGSDFVRVPNNASLNFGTGDLSMDAWVRFAQPFSGVRSIVDKRGGTISAPVGYLFFTINDRLAFQLDDGTAFNYISGAPGLADGQWHHVAATVHRTSTTGGRLYVDGNVVLIFDPTNRPGSITNASALNLGQQNFAPAAFAGDLDEVEVFRGALDSTSVRAVYQAGARGKCKERASLPAATTFCLGQTVASATLTLCNGTVTAQTFTWSLAGLPVGPGCTIPGPTVFTPPAGTVTIPAGGCVNIPFTIQRPAGLVPGQTACYEVTVLDSLGHCFNATGRLTAVDIICNIIKNQNWLVLPFPATGAFEWGWTNPLQHDQDVPFQVVALDEDGHPDAIVSLNGLPPGEPYLGTLHLVAGDTYEHLLRVSVTPLDHDPFGFHTILLEADTNGDGQMEPLSSGTMYTVLPEDLPTGTPPDAQAPLSGVRVQPNPFLGTTNVAFTLARTTPVTVRVYDLLGRLVRSLEDARLEPGAHFVTWDGRDQAGRDVGHGIYLVRVHAGDRVETAKVVRMR